MNNQLNVLYHLKKEGKVGAIKQVLARFKYFITYSSKAVVILWFSAAYVWCQSFGDVSPYACSYYIKFGFRSWEVILLERDAHSVDHRFSLNFDYL